MASFVYKTRQSAASAKVAELVDALDLGSSGATRESSSLSFRTNIICMVTVLSHQGMYNLIIF